MSKRVIREVVPIGWPVTRCRKCNEGGVYYVPSSGRYPRALVYEDGSLHNEVCPYKVPSIATCEGDRVKYPLLWDEEGNRLPATASSCSSSTP